MGWAGCESGPAASIRLGSSEAAPYFSTSRGGGVAGRSLYALARAWHTSGTWRDPIDGKSIQFNEAHGAGDFW
jgi:hypothetical protein